MFTLIYYQGKFNRPDTLIPFLEGNVGKAPLLQIDCVTPYQGTVQSLIQEVCDYLNKLTSHIEVCYTVTSSQSTEVNQDGTMVNYLAIQLQVKQRS